ncbi:hypothetical protein [Massilia aerilata]|uniref:Uncharacterized protein n=1 Tax=Massilia aerilata TaxID=453817 RepID=A0ABW0S2Z9_9BURK
MSSGLFSEVPPGAALLFALVITFPTGLTVASMVKSYHEKVACDTAAAEWEAGNVNGAVYRPSDAAHFAKKYDAFRTACPNGHSSVDESRLPAAVKAGYVPAKN